MKILIFGASGGTGRELLAQAGAAGHQVTVFARNPAGLGAAGTKVRIVAGDVLRDPDAVAAAVRGQDAVISALGRGYSLRSRGLMTGAMRAILPAMAAAGVRRLVVVSAFGVGATRRDASPVQHAVCALPLRFLYADKLAAESAIRAAEVDFTLLYPVRLVDGPPTGRYEMAPRLEMKGVPKISRGDVAHACLAVLEDPSTHGESYVLRDRGPQPA